VVVSVFFFPCFLIFRSRWDLVYCKVDRASCDVFTSGLVIRVPGYRSRGTGSIPGATRFSEK
jgi:hypothetical protein